MTVGPARNGEWEALSAEFERVKPIPCPCCAAPSPCIDYNSVGIGVGTMIFEETYECWVHGVFGFNRDGELCWMRGAPEPLTAEEKLEELDQQIGWEPSQPGLTPSEVAARELVELLAPFGARRI